MKRAFRIVVPLDGSDLAAQALPLAEHLCTQLGGELELVRVISSMVLPTLAGSTYIPGDIYQQLETDREREAAEYLSGVGADARSRGAHTHTHVEWGEPASAVLAQAVAVAADLIVMSTHGRTGLARFALGSVADRVVRAGEAPVLLLRSFPTDIRCLTTYGSDLRRALVPLDGSPLAASVLYSVALRLAGPVVQEITLLRVADPRDRLAGKLGAEAYLDGQRQRLRERLAGCHCTVSQHVCVSKNPAQCIVERAEAECDLVLMSTHGETGIGRWTFGGVTDGVLRDGKTPLLVVHPPREAQQ
jgi:nucleotide-binding universal stress UspA family protein